MGLLYRSAGSGYAVCACRGKFQVLVRCQQGGGKPIERSNVLTSCFLDYICLLMMKLTWAVFTTGYALKSKISKWDFHSNATQEPFKNLSVTFSFAYCEKHFNNLKNLMVCKGSS